MNFSTKDENINYADWHGAIMKEKIHTYEFTNEIRVCPLCGYEDGFHTMFRRDGKNIRWFLICSSCHELFDFGLEYKG
jgi:hypothetical protein